jgi:hypothetical protein
MSRPSCAKEEEESAPIVAHFTCSARGERYNALITLSKNGQITRSPDRFGSYSTFT